jgi:membrane-associated protease RseP (regulator of RpoE activity)
MDQVDLERTGKENAQRGVNFTFYTYPMISDPGPVLAPGSYAPACPAQAATARQTKPASTASELAAFGATGTASEKGLVVNTVQVGSPAAQAGLQAGDVVVRVDCRPIHQAADMENAFAGSNGPVWVSYLIQGAWLTDKKVSR